MRKCSKQPLYGWNNFSPAALTTSGLRRRRNKTGIDASGRDHAPNVWYREFEDFRQQGVPEHGDFVCGQCTLPRSMVRPTEGGLVPISRLAAVNVVVAAARRAALPSTACVPPARSSWRLQNPKNGVAGARDGPGRMISAMASMRRSHTCLSGCQTAEKEFVVAENCSLAAS